MATKKATKPGLTAGVLVGKRYTIGRYGAIVYLDHAREWRWRIYARANQKIVADSGEGYSSVSNAKRALQRLCFMLHDNSLRLAPL